MITHSCRYFGLKRYTIKKAPHSKSIKGLHSTLSNHTGTGRIGTSHDPPISVIVKASQGPAGEASGFVSTVSSIGNRVRKREGKGMKLAIHTLQKRWRRRYTSSPRRPAGLWHEGNRSAMRSRPMQRRGRTDQLISFTSYFGCPLGSICRMSCVQSP